MCRFKQQALLACTIAVFLLVVTAGSASAQDVPSHTQVSPAPGGGFDFPAQLTFFTSLATDANGIIANVTQGNFSNARALLANYNSTIDSLNAAVNASQRGTAIPALAASRDDFATFIKDAQRFNDLYVNETSLISAATPTNASIANALEMQTLNATLTGLHSTIEGRNADIYGAAVNNGLNLAQYGNSTALFTAYATQVDSRLANVTTNVFSTPTLTLRENTGHGTYGNAIVLAGGLLNGQTGIRNSPVAVLVDNATVATVRTNANGSFAYPLTINTIAPGTHVASATFAPANAPYNPAHSGGSQLHCRNITGHQHPELSVGEHRARQRSAGAGPADDAARTRYERHGRAQRWWHRHSADADRSKRHVRVFSPRQRSIPARSI